MFATYELLQQIILEIPPSDILSAAKVNKIWNATVSSSATISKQLLSSYFALSQMHINSDRLQADKITRLSLFWGEVYIKALRSEQNKEVVLTINKSDHQVFSIGFLNTTEGIPGLTREDYQRTSKGLTSALSGFRAEHGVSRTTTISTLESSLGFMCSWILLVGRQYCWQIESARQFSIATAG